MRDELTCTNLPCYAIFVHSTQPRDQIWSPIWAQIKGEMEKVKQGWTLKLFAKGWCTGRATNHRPFTSLSDTLPHAPLCSVSCWAVNLFQTLALIWLCIQPIIRRKYLNFVFVYQTNGMLRHSFGGYYFWPLD